MSRVPVLDVKEVEATAEDAAFVIGFDAETLARMQAAEAPLKLAYDLAIHRSTGHL
ncbi:MAG: hypothetical protein WCF13_13350 [Stellaceae bacterium]